MGRVSGKIVIVTGAARGMGASHARRLVEEGAQVMLTDVLDAEGAALAKTLGKNARFLHQDVTSETEAVFGSVSVLVNNAGIATYGAIETLEEADYRRTIDINQVSVFLEMASTKISMQSH